MSAAVDDVIGGVAMRLGNCTFDRVAAAHVRHSSRCCGRSTERRVGE